MATALNTTTSRVARLRGLAAGAGRVRLPWIPVFIMGVLVFCALFAQWLTPYDPTQISMLEAKIAPVPFGENWTWSHLLGTDIMGRDMLSRLIHGAQTAVLISLVALGTGMAVGTILGVKGGEKVYHCGGGIVYHRHDEKGLNWEPGGIRSGAGVRSSGVSQESTGSSDTWEAALCRLCLRR